MQMVLFYIAIPFVLFAVLRFLVALYNFLFSPYLKGYPLTDVPKVSVLIDAQTNSSNLESLLLDLLNQKYKNIEVIVGGNFLGNNIESILRKDSRFSAISTNTSGKVERNKLNFDLGNRATGEYLLFIDESVRLSVNFIGRALAYMQVKRLTSLTFLPYRITRTFGESVLANAMDWLLVSTYPFQLTGNKRKVLISAATFSPIMFKTDIYQKHELYKVFYSTSNPNKIKWQIPGNVEVLLGTQDNVKSVSRNTLEECSKSMLNAFGGSSSSILLIALLSTLGLILVLFVAPYPLVFAYFFSALLTRILVADTTKHAVWKSVALLPFIHYTFLKMVNIIYRNFRKAGSKS